MNKKIREDNRGMMLLEVLVAVSIFAIVAIVLLQGFVTSSRVNKKSNAYLEATTTAQNIMEEIKAKTSFEEVALAFNYPKNLTNGECRFGFLEDQKSNINNTDAKDDNLVIKELLKSGNDYHDVRLYENSGEDESRVTASILSKDNGNTYTFLPRESGENASKYYFELAGIQNETQKFDALVTFDGSKSSGYKKKTATNKEEGKNDYLMPNISKLDTKSNGFLIMEKDWDENAMQTIIKEQNTAALQKWTEQHNVSDAGQPEEFNYEDVYAHTKRILEIQVTQEAGVVTAKARYTLYAYDYKKSDGNEYETMSICPCGGKNLGKSYGDEDWIQGCFCTYVSAYTVFYSSEAGSDLKGIYVFYYPNYNSISSVKPLDEIVVDNTSNLDFDLYVTKQREENSPSASEEGSYHMALTVEEKPADRGNTNWNTNLSLYRAKIRLRTNLDYDISNLTKNSRPKLSQMRLTYQEQTASGGLKKASGNSAKTILQCNTIDDKEAYDRIYDATVSIYKAGAAKEGFPKKDLILSIDGAKED